MCYINLFKIILKLFYHLRKKGPSLGGLEPPTFRLTVERANRLRHRDLLPRQKSNIILTPQIFFSIFM